MLYKLNFGKLPIFYTFTDNLGNYYRRYRKWEINYLIFIEFH